MGKKTDPIPDNMTIEEASEFWDTHSVADYHSRVVQFEFKPEGRTTFVAIADELLEQLEKRAKKSGISIETLVNLWIQERLTALFWL
jgi:predicted DNA binding CopG/RHH family protein